MNNTALLGITFALVILGSTSFAFASTDVIESYEKIDMTTVGKSDGSTIGFGAGDNFGYKITNMGDLDNNGADDFATIAFGADGIGHNELNPSTQTLLGTSYLTLLHTNGTVKASHELSNCAADNNELRETRTFGESLDYLGEIDGNPTLLISDYWFDKIHVLTIDSTDYTHTCSEITVNGLSALGWPFSVAGTLEVDNVVDTIPDLIAGADNADGTGTDLYVLDLDMDAQSNFTVSEQKVDTSRITTSDSEWLKRYFENSVVADIDGDNTTIDVVIGEPRAFIGDDPDTSYNGAIHVLFIDSSSYRINKVTTIEFSDLGVDINRNNDAHFGIGLANMGDLNNDGVDDMAVGLEGASIGNTNSGAVTIMFLDDKGSLINLKMISNDITQPYPLGTSDLFGKGLESLDVDGSGLLELAVSAHQDNTGATNAGAVYVMTFDSNELNGLSYDMTPTPIALNPTFDNFFKVFSQFAYADDPTPKFGVVSLPFTSTITVVDDVLTVQTVNFDVSDDPTPTYCNDSTIDELIASGNYTVFDNRDGSLGSKVKGTNGNDLMIASDNGDTLIGKQGDDCMIGGSGDDTLKGKSGNDEMYGNDGNDLIRGNMGDDIIYGNSGNDELHGGQDSDIINGGLGDDILRGKKGSDTLNGGEGNDSLFGGKDNDSLYGNEGNDTLNGRKGIDACDGGTGTNTFKNCEL